MLTIRRCMYFLISFFCLLGSVQSTFGQAQDNVSPPSDYYVQPGDVLAISVWDEPALQAEVIVLPDSTISFPLAGTVAVDGLTVSALRDHLTDKLLPFIPSVSVHVGILQARGSKVFVLGKVNRPGEYVLDRPLRVTHAMAMAGGFTSFADTDEVMVLRESGSVQDVVRVPYDDIVSGDSLDKNIWLQPGDLVVVQ